MLYCVIVLKRLPGCRQTFWRPADAMIKGETLLTKIKEKIMHAACMLLVCIIASTAHSPLTEWDSMGPCASPLEVVKLVQPFQCRFRKYAPIGSVMMSLWSYRPPQSRSKREGKARIRKALRHRCFHSPLKAAAWKVWNLWAAHLDILYTRQTGHDWTLCGTLPQVCLLQVWACKQDKSWPVFLVRNTGLAGIKVSEAFLRVRI
jgi:hypothetical protein